MQVNKKEPVLLSYNDILQNEGIYVPVNGRNDSYLIVISNSHYSPYVLYFCQDILCAAKEEVWLKFVFRKLHNVTLNVNIQLDSTPIE